MVFQSLVFTNPFTAGKTVLIRSLYNHFKNLCRLPAVRMHDSPLYEFTSNQRGLVEHLVTT